MFKIHSLLLFLILAMSSSLATASHIKPDVSDHFSLDNKQVLQPKNTHDEELSESTFDEELQWRILNLLAQQLFDDSHETLSSYLFSSSWMYQTSTFSVNISAINPDFLEVRITDSKGGDETRLEIPRL